MKYTHRRGFIDRESYVAQYIALALLSTGLAASLGLDDLLAAFAAGNAMSWDGTFNDQTEGEVFSSVIDLVLNCACFVYIGAWLPFDQFNAPAIGLHPWRLVVLLISILLLRRIPSTFLLYRWVPEIRTWREALFSGHFGPVSIYLYLGEPYLNFGRWALVPSLYRLWHLPSCPHLRTPHNHKLSYWLRYFSLLYLLSFLVQFSFVSHPLIHVYQLTPL
jgi:NhaP-type Na+/H+ or K+/H+ antiporter